MYLGEESKFDIFPPRTVGRPSYTKIHVTQLKKSKNFNSNLKQLLNTDFSLHCVCNLLMFCLNLGHTLHFCAFNFNLGSSWYATGSRIGLQYTKYKYDTKNYHQSGGILWCTGGKVVESFGRNRIDRLLRRSLN